MLVVEEDQTLTNIWDKGSDNNTCNNDAHQSEEHDKEVQPDQLCTMVDDSEPYFCMCWVIVLWCRNSGHSITG